MSAKPRVVKLKAKMKPSRVVRSQTNYRMQVGGHATSAIWTTNLEH